MEDWFAVRDEGVEDVAFGFVDALLIHRPLHFGEDLVDDLVCD